MSVYGFPNFNIKRSGLGNLLIIWARCEVFCRDHGCQMLAPLWTQPKIGPLLRREKDLRYYTGIFKPRPEYITGLRKFWLIRRGQCIDEREVTPADLAAAQRNRHPTLVQFWTEKDLLTPLISQREFIQAQLRAILSDSTIELLKNHLPKERFIAAHVRRGDKPTLKVGEPIPAHPHWSLPDEWFIRVIETARKRVGSTVPVRIFSDAHPQQLSRLLAMPNVQLAGTENAMVDILLLSKASALITSGTSTFSMWAAFLGGMPTLWFPGLLTSLNANKPWYDLESDLEGNVPESFGAAYMDFITHQQTCGAMI